MRPVSERFRPGTIFFKLPRRDDKRAIKPPAVPKTPFYRARPEQRLAGQPGTNLPACQ